MDLTTKQVADKLGEASRVIRLWCKQGRFPNARLEQTPRGDVWLIPESDLNNFQKPKMGRPTWEDRLYVRSLPFITEIKEIRNQFSDESLDFLVNYYLKNNGRFPKSKSELNALNPNNKPFNAELVRMLNSLDDKSTEALMYVMSETTTDNYQHEQSPTKCINTIINLHS